MAKRLNKNLVAMLTFVGFASAIGVSVLLIGQLKSQDPKYFVDLAFSVMGRFKGGPAKAAVLASDNQRLPGANDRGLQSAGGERAGAGREWG